MGKKREERMSWTRTKPTVAGWYWYRGAYDVNPAGIQKEPVIVFVEIPRNGHKKTLAGWQPFLNVHVPLTEFTGEWCGPIPEPVEQYSDLAPNTVALNHDQFASKKRIV